MGASRPGEASKLFEERFAAGDLDGLMDLYEDGAVFTKARGAHEGPDAIREVLAGYLATGASIVMNESVAFEAGELALVHWAWTMNFPDARVAEGQPQRSSAVSLTGHGSSSLTTLTAQL
jgi:ketosteroid isomerase-like protein